MPQTITIPNYTSLNTLERTQMTADSAASTTSVGVESTNNFAADDYILVGRPGGETSDLVQLTSITAPIGLNATGGFAHAHNKFDAVTKLYGNKIKVYRAANSDGTIPSDDAFASIATVDIDPDQGSTDYVDSSGGSDYWYKYTYYNSTAATETNLADSTAVRGGGANNYASISSIRQEAGLNNNIYITDDLIDEKRQAAQSLIDATLYGKYTVPFATPVNPLIAEITRSLAAGYLLTDDYGATQTLDTRQGQSKIDYVTNKDGTGILDKLNAGTLSLVGLLGASEELTTAGGFSMWPDGTTNGADYNLSGDDGFGFKRSTRY